MKPSHFALLLLRQLQYGFVLSAVAFAAPSLSLYAEDGESGEQSPVAVLTQTIQSGAAKTALLAVRGFDVHRPRLLDGRRNHSLARPLLASAPPQPSVKGVRHV